METVSLFCSVESMEAIKKIQNLKCAALNRFLGLVEKLSRSSSKSAFDMNQHNKSSWRKLWSSELNERLKVLLWRVAVGAFPLKCKTKV